METVKQFNTKHCNSNIPIVSVIVPTYNREEYLVECIESILAQTLEDIEILCIDDASTDRTVEILSKYAERDSRIKVICKDTNLGFGNSMNIGLDNATGEYIGIVESDDYILPQMYEKYYGTAIELGNLDIVKSDVCWFFGNGKDRIFETHRLSENDDYYLGIWCPKEQIELFNLYNLCQPGIYRRQFLLKNDIRWHETPGASFQDNGFWFQVFALAESARFLNDRFYMLRRDNETSSVNNPKKVYCMSVEYDHIRQKIIEKQGRLHKEILGVLSYMRYRNYVFTLHRIAPRYKQEFINYFAFDFMRLKYRDELIEQIFHPIDWKVLNEMLEDPVAYFKNHWKSAIASVSNEDAAEKVRTLSADNASLNEAIQQMQSSRSMRIGKAITALPRALKRVFNKGSH